MRPVLRLVAVLVSSVSLVSLVPRPAAAADAPRLDLGHWLAAAGSTTVPAAWAGVWSFEDDDYDCDTNMLLSSDVSADTLCTNEQIFEDPGVAGWSCSGTVSDTSIDINCSGSEEVDTGCTLDFVYTLTATRVGDTLLATVTIGRTFTPTGCGFLPDFCLRTESTGTRIGPEPPNCTTAVAPSTWGRTKSQYR